MDIIIKVFGEGKDLTMLQMSARAFVVYFIALVLIRISGKRTFGKKSAFDTCISIIVGAVLSRAIVGASPFASTVAGSLALVLLHRALGMAILYNKTFGKLLKGEKVLLFKNGNVLEQNLRKCLITHDDLISDVRLKANAKSLDSVEEIYMENSGELSIILKK
nr:YetF domain-containing protein [uncultured Mucilaginibacter sp.]